MYDNQVFSYRNTTDTIATQKAFFLKHGYSSQMYWEQTPGLLKPLRKHVGSDVIFLEREHGYRFLHTEGIYATCLFAHMVVRMQTITGARIGEVQQVSQNPDCIKELAGIGPKATTRWLLRMIPKGRRERGDYFIDSDTKDVLAEVVRFHRQMLGVKKLPIVNHQSSKYARDRYLLQWNGLPLDQSTLNTALRFLLHGAVIDSGGVGVHLTSHVLRHGFATEMASLKVPVEVIAQILHQRHVEVTRYYSRPTKQQVMQAAELLFVDRIDMAAEALRSPDEIAQMLRKAEGQIGALTEVLGGTCVVSNMCPAKFACVGCSGNAPDPERRYQIEKKRSWALQQISWANREGLPAEERQMKQLVQDCDLMLEEMGLIERARSDSRQQVVVRKDAKHGTG
jgi:integrase